MAETSYNGETFFDDRLFVLHLCKCTVSKVDEETEETIIHHENAPNDHQWCVATYKNQKGYPLVRVDHFRSLVEARSYLETTEPTVPLVSLEGRSPSQPLTYPNFLQWKVENGFKDYDYRTVYSEGGENAKEMVLSRRR